MHLKNKFKGKVHRIWKGCYTGVKIAGVVLEQFLDLEDSSKLGKRGY